MVRILVIDDEAQVRAFVRNTLEASGHDVAEAADGDAGLRAFEARPADLVITDIVMPGINGDELARLVKAQRPEVKLLYMSGYTELARTLSSAVQARLLPKPFSPDALLHRVRRVLDSGVG